MGRLALLFRASAPVPRLSPGRVQSTRPGSSTATPLRLWIASPRTPLRASGAESVGIRPYGDRTPSGHNIPGNPRIEEAAFGGDDDASVDHDAMSVPQARLRDPRKSWAL